MKTETAFSKAILLVTLVIPLTLSAGKEEEALQIGTEAYIYGYPLVLMDVTKRVATNVPFPQKGRAPVNQFAHTWEFVTADNQDLLHPSVDTLASSAWLDLEKEPILLHVPEIRERFYQITLYDAWSNVFGSLEKKGDFALVGPDWKGVVPKGVTEIRAPTTRVLVLGRIQCNGNAKDYAIVNYLQKQLTLTPLSAKAKSYRPPSNVAIDAKVNARSSPKDQVEAMSGATFFNAVARLIKAFPPPTEDKAMLEKMAKIGLIPGVEIDPEAAKGLEGALVAGQKKIRETQGTEKNGWRTHLAGENFGTHYLQRAAVAKSGLGSSQNVVTLSTELDSAGKPLNGASHYRLHFDKEQLPPVSAFWSITLYDEEQHLIPNRLNRYGLQSSGKTKYNDDGSLDIYFQKEEPIKKRANWLPVNKGDFQVVLRLYHPKEPWTPPRVQRIE